MKTNRIVAEFFVDHGVVLNAMDCSRSKTFSPTLFLLQVSWWWLFSFLVSLPVSLDIQSALEQGLQGDRLKKKNSHPQLKNTKNQLQDQSNSNEHHLFSSFQFWNWKIAHKLPKPPPSRTLHQSTLLLPGRSSKSRFFAKARRHLWSFEVSWILLRLLMVSWIMTRL